MGLKIWAYVPRWLSVVSDCSDDRVDKDTRCARYKQYTLGHRICQHYLHHTPVTTLAMYAILTLFCQILWPSVYGAVQICISPLVCLHVCAWLLSVGQPVDWLVCFLCRSVYYYYYYYYYYYCSNWYSAERWQIVQWTSPVVELKYVRVKVDAPLKERLLEI